MFAENTRWKHPCFLWTGIKEHRVPPEFEIVSVASEIEMFTKMNTDFDF